MKDQQARQRTVDMVIAGLGEAVYEANKARVAADTGNATVFGFAIRRIRTYAQQVIRECDELLKGDD